MRNSTTRNLLLLQNNIRPLHEILRYLSKERFQDITSEMVESIIDHLSPDDLIYGSHITLIQVSSKDLRITFKAHFNVDETSALIRADLNFSPTKDYDVSLTNDLFKEYCNLVAGGLCQYFLSVNILAGLSLPLATSGIDEIFHSDQLRDFTLTDYWILQGEKFKFTCTVLVDVLNDDLKGCFSFNEEFFKSSEINSIDIL
jgi:hypothetical protein